MSDIHIPKLVTFAAYPASGKSTLAGYLEEELDFVRLSGDEALRAEYGGPNWYGNIARERAWAAFGKLYADRDRALLEGKDVVIDTTGHTERFRQANLGTDSQCERYLVWIRINPHLQMRIIDDRIRDGRWKRGESDPIGTWEKEYGWEDPVEAGDYQLVTYDNIREGDLDDIKEDLRKVLESERTLMDNRAIMVEDGESGLV